MSETESTVARADLAVGDRIDGFELEAWLGAGAVSNVWVARVPDGRYAELQAERAAIKIMRLDRIAADDLRKRFVREARISLRLRHENLVRGLAHGQRKVGAGRQPYLVMEYHPGVSLRSVLSPGSPVSEGFAREVGLQLARAVTAIHQAGLLHRDIKPANVLLTDSGVVKLLDLGVALDPTSLGKLTAPGFFVGTVTHAAPERLVDETEDPASDLYAVGLVLYELVTGGNPFVARTMQETMNRHLKLQPPAPMLINPGLSAWFSSVIMRLLAKSPADRLPSARALAQVLADPTKRSTARCRGAYGVLHGGEARAPIGLVGRAAAVGQLRRFTRGVIRGQRASLLIHGPRGVGKTALASELTAWSSAGGLRAGVQVGRCPVPGALDRHRALREAMLSLLAVEDDPGFGPGPEGEIVSSKRSPALLAFLVGTGPTAMSGGLATEIATCLTELAVAMPQVIVIDDSHRLTAEAADLIGAVADAVGSAPVSVVLVASDPITPELERLRRQLAATEFAVGPMPRGALERYLITRDVAATDAHRILGAIRAPELAQPGALAVLVTWLVRSGWLERGRGDRLRLTGAARLARLPADLDALSAARLSELAAGERELLEAVALASPWADIPLVALVCNRPPLQVARELAELEAEGLVRSRGSCVELAGGALARFVDTGVQGTARRQLLGRIGDAWLRRGGRRPAGRLLVEAVRHLLAGGATAQALLPALVAGRFLHDSGASGDAIRLLALGNRVPAGGAATQLADLLDELAEAVDLDDADRELARRTARRYRG